MKAINQITMQADAYRRGDLQRDFIVGDTYIQQAVMKQIHATLEKYIRHVDFFHGFYLQRFYWFDFEQYQKDLEKFGIEIPEKQSL